MDGAFVQRGGQVEFVECPLNGGDVERVCDNTRSRVVRWLGRKGYLSQDVEDSSNEAEEPDALATCQQLALRFAGLSRGDGDQRTDRAIKQERRFRPRLVHPLHHRTEDGFDLDARVRIEQGDDLGRERLVRYGARPGIVLERLTQLGPAARRPTIIDKELYDPSPRRSPFILTDRHMQPTAKILEPRWPAPDDQTQCRLGLPARTSSWYLHVDDFGTVAGWKVLVQR